MRILVSGGRGSFSRALISCKTIHEIFPISKEEMDVSCAKQIEECLKKYEPDIVIHAAAITRPMSKHEKRPDLSISSNIIGTANITIECMKRGTKLVYISTDHVYPGIRGNYSEEDSLKPVNKYAWSKLGGECSVALYDNSLILRMAMTPRPFVHPRALTDSRKSSIFIDEAAEICLKLIEEKGIINIGGKPQTIHDFAKISNPDVKKISLKDIKDVHMPVDSTMKINKMTDLLND